MPLVAWPVTKNGTFVASLPMMVGTRIPLVLAEAMAVSTPPTVILVESTRTPLPAFKPRVKPEATSRTSVPFMLAMRLNRRAFNVAWPPA